MNDEQPAPWSSATCGSTPTSEGWWSVTMEELMDDLDPGWLAGTGWPPVRRSEA